MELTVPVRSGSYRKKSCSRKTCSDDADQEECDRNRLPYQDGGHAICSKGSRYRSCSGRKAGVIDGSYLREGQIVIDVGINVNEEGKLCGDVNFEEAEKIVEAITPVPRGVGGVTTSILLEHVVDAAIAQNR